VRTLPLYTKPEPLAVDECDALAVDPKCMRCGLHEKTTTVCMGPVGEAPGLLVVGEYPAQDEDRRGKPFVSRSGLLLRELIEKHWKGRIVYDNGVKCAPGKDGATPKQVDACRPFLAHTVRTANPERIICVGSGAALSVLGRAVSPMQTRRGYAYRATEAIRVARDLGGDAAVNAIMPDAAASGAIVPVFTVLSPAFASRNRFIRKWFEDDLEWALTALPPAPPWGVTIELVDSYEDALAAAWVLRRAPWFSFDHETAGVMFDPSFRILCTALSTPRMVNADGGRRVFVWTKNAVSRTLSRDVLTDLLASASARKTGANTKYDMSSTYSTTGRMPEGVMGDVRLTRRLLDPESGAKLSVMAELVGMGGHKGENKDAIERGIKTVRALLKDEKKSGVSVATLLNTYGLDPALASIVRGGEHEDLKWAFATVPESTLYRYCARDAVATADLQSLLGPQLDAQPQIKRAWDMVISGASTAVAQVEAWGIGCDRQAVLDFDAHLAVREAVAFQGLDVHFQGINWSSPKQVGEILFKKLGLPSVKLTDTHEESTDKEVLDTLKAYHPLVSHLIEYRRMVKLRGTYANGLLRHIRPDGRIHPSFLLDGARSGRMSSQDPNLQNIPSEKRDPILGKMSRDCFVAREGWTLLSADYAQIELRVAAMLSGDALMIAAFARGEDIHAVTAELVCKMVWGKEWRDADDIERKKFRALVKPIVFGLLYGKGDDALADELSKGGTPCTKAEAARARQAIMGKYRRLDAWCKERLAETRLSGEAWTWWAGERAHRRQLWRIADPDDLTRSTAEHGSWNTPVQGTAAYYCTKSLVDVVSWIRDDSVPAVVVAPVHDQLLMEVRNDVFDECAAQVKRIMEAHPCAGLHPVPILVDMERGASWGSLVKCS